MQKKCPKCGKTAVRLYHHTTVEGKRRWIPIAWWCTHCRYVYTIASETLIYKMGGDRYEEKFHSACPKCEGRLCKAYRHINPKQGKQQWLSVGHYCPRCRYVWLDENDDE